MKITQNGPVYLQLLPGRTYTFLAAGSFGGGNAYLTLADGVFTGILMPGHETISGTTAFRFIAPLPYLVVELENATAPSFTVDCVLCPC